MLCKLYWLTFLSFPKVHVTRARNQRRSLIIIIVVVVVVVDLYSAVRSSLQRRWNFRGVDSRNQRRQSYCNNKL